MSAEVWLNLFQTATMMFVFLSTIRLIGSGLRTTKLVFFAFAVLSLLLSNLYWLAYDILRPGTRMPFAANEIAEWAMFLSLGASLDAKLLRRPAGWEVGGAAGFAAANVGLWIAWSGEWVQDILTGAAFGYFLCCLVVRMKREKVLSSLQWRLLGGCCFVLIAAQTAIFFVPAALQRLLDLFCYLLLFAGCGCFLFAAIRSLRSNERPAAAVCRAYAADIWVVITLYMSADYYYVAALLLACLCYPLMLLALRKEAAA